MLPSWPKAAEGWEPQRQDTYFSFGKPEAEMNCAEIRVFMRCVGRLRMEKRQIFMPPNATISDAQKQFGREFDQTHVRDERGFVIENHTRPLSDYSSKCRLNLDFTYEQARLQDWFKERLASETEAIQKKMKTERKTLREEAMVFQTLTQAQTADEMTEQSRKAVVAAAAGPSQ
mmetsp:Transcript_8903/g.23625  ORF Transcript_8903/g.23625 Transcript_8903/m.23625 type:complete len:174 (-) Transcript_8903:167-688(-)